NAIASINVTGAQEIVEEALICPRRIYVETDPVAMQVSVAEGDQNTIQYLAAHHALFTFGELIGTPGCRVPVERFTWLPTRQPVVLDLWQAPGVGADAYTTIATWKNTGQVVYRGETYRWSKDRQFMNVVDLPRRRGQVRFEIALGAEPDVHQLLERHGWGV